MNDVLIHYGVKGMKWGVRKEYEGTGGGGGGGWGPSTIAGGGGPSPLAASMAGNPKKKKAVGKNAVEKMGIDTAASPELARKLITGETEARKKEDAMWKERDKEVSNVKTPENWFGPDGRLSEEGRKAMDIIGEIDERYSKREMELWDEHKREINDMQQKVFLNKEIEPEVRAARETLNKIDTLRDNMIGPNSQAYKDAFAKYKEAHKDSYDAEDIAYGFDHYEWQSGHKDYDAAYKSMKRESKNLDRDYQNQVVSIGKKILDKQYDKLADTAMYEVDYYISSIYDEQKK